MESVGTEKQFFPTTFFYEWNFSQFAFFLQLRTFVYRIFSIQADKWKGREKKKCT